MKTKDHSPIIVSILFFFICLFLYTKFVGPVPFSVNSTVTNKSDIFSSMGEGKIVVKPDTAFVSVGIEKSAPTVKEAQDQINVVIKNISDAYKKLKIDEKDIQTANYSINPTIDWSSGRQKITGYMANTNLTIKVKNIDQVNDVIDLATVNGANQVGNIYFDIDNRQQYEDTVRKEAVAKAKENARIAAGEAGFKLGRIINYYEDNGVIPSPVYRAAGGALDSMKAPTTQIQTGSTEIKMTVTLSYEIQ